MSDAMTDTGARGGRLAPAAKGLATVLLLAIAGCATEEKVAPATAVAPAPAFAADALVGRWGVGAYHLDKDRARTEKEARALCGKPYVIAQGSNGGVMMHLADQKVPQEVIVKVAPDGTTYVGPEGPPGIPEDRQVIAFDGTTLISRWVDPEVFGRYGTMVLVRCKPR
jgi:hypothetical protein